MFTKIQVTLDGSAFSELSLPYAHALAKRFGADVDLVMVHEPVPGLETEMWDQESVAWSTDYIAKVAEDFAKSTDAKTTYALEHGPVVRTLLGHAETHGADLIIAATHGRGALSRAWLGSVADGLLRHSEIPVLLVREDDDEEDDSDELPEVNRILVTLDGSEVSESILSMVPKLANGFEASIHLVRIVPFPREISSPYLPTTVQMNQKVIKEAKDAAEADLQEKVNLLAAQGIDAKPHVMVATQAAREICETADEIDADLIVMSTHGRSGISRALLGSTADKVIRGAEVPVLVRRPQD